MKFLFIDTETNGLISSQDQIIEVAGLVFELDINTLNLVLTDSFDSLISLRQDYDPKIQRLTDILKEDLLQAPTLNQVQNQWLSFLDQYPKIEAIVGHSVNFDLDFLNSEGWFLPQKAKIIDTLDIAKIVYPDLEAINLEFLSAKLGITQIPKSLKLKDHRALYDTWMCANFYEYSLKISHKLGIPQNYLEDLIKKFFGLEFPIYTSSLIDSKNDYEEKVNNPITVFLDSKIQQADYAIKIKNLDLKILNNICIENPGLPKQFLKVILQIIVIYFSNQKDLKLHLQKNTLEKTFLDFLLMIIIPKSELPTKYILEPVENLLLKYEQLSLKSLDLKFLIDSLEILSLLDYTDQTIQQVLSSYDFLLVSLYPLINYGEYNLKKLDPKPEDQNFQGKLTAFLDKTYSLKFALENLKNTTKSNRIANKIIEEILKIIEEIKIVNNFRKITYNDHSFKIWSKKESFELQNYFDNLIKNFKITDIETFLNPEEFLHFQDYLNLKLGSLTIKYLSKKTVVIKSLKTDYQNLETFTKTIFENIDKQKISLILTTRNKTQQELQNYITNNYNQKDYLIFGENGSLTKIISKVNNGFLGLLVLKHSDFEYFSRYNTAQIQSIYLIGQPFFMISPFLLAQLKISNKEEAKEYVYKINTISRYRKIGATEVIL
jgi:DNA polymerase III epsilon subunit-like protein